MRADAGRSCPALNSHRTSDPAGGCVTMGHPALKLEPRSVQPDRPKKPKKPKEPHPADDLSFMKTKKLRGIGIDYWDVPVVGHHLADWQIGEHLAKEYLAYIGKHSDW